ncbi:MAG: hypothetical protein N2999_07740 [Proteobacteria bacterium]|nr:hypothetical protein [Pseudomonadota bacterium]
MKKSLFAVIILGVVFLSRFASATPSTQIWIPSPDIQAYKVFHLGFDTYMKTEKQSSGTREPSIINNGVTVGVLPFEKIQAEIGIDQRVVGAEPYDSNPLYFNFKVGTPEDSLFKGSPAIAVGGYDFGTKSDLTDFNLMYAVLGKTFGIGRFCVGYFVGNDKLLLDSNGKKDNEGILLSWDRTMKEISDKLWVAVDYQGTKSGYGALSAGIAWKFADNVSVIFGYNVYNNDNYKPTATIQVDIDIK